MAVEVYPGNTGDPTTVPDQVEKLRERFGLSRVVLAGDRGMLTQTQIEHLKEHPGLGWISCLRSGAIRQLIDDGRLPRSLFDERNLAEISSPEFPGERLVACYNPLLADQRRQRREELLAATERNLKRLAAEVARRTKKPLGKATIALKAGKIIGRYKMAKHFALTIEEGVFQYRRDEASIERERQLDGIYVVRTGEPAKRIPADDAVRHYKRTGGRGASVPQPEERGPAGASDLSPHRDRGAGTRVVVCLGLLRPVAPEAGVGAVVVRGGGPAGDSPLARSGGRRRAFATVAAKKAVAPQRPAGGRCIASPRCCTNWRRDVAPPIASYRTHRAARSTN